MLKPRNITIGGAAALAAGLLFGAVTHAGIFESRDEQRTQIDADEKTTLARLFKESAQARRLYESAYGYATFDIIKVSLGLTGGGGQGAAVNKTSGARTYMRMGTGGINFGAGGQLYQLVFLFEDGQSFEKFVSDGWEAGASANAVAGPLGANAGTSFINGVAVYQLTEAGLMLLLDISGTKYWKSKLNR
jgi:lipid-binding SYLF domain-containing protein